MPNPSRIEILSRLRRRITAGRPIVMGGATTAGAARIEALGPCDLIVLAPPQGDLLACNTANRQVRDLGEEVLHPLLRCPALAGVVATDPFTAIRPFLEDLKAMGFSGVQNALSIGRYSGRIRASFEDSGMPYAMEVEMITLARTLDLLTAACVHSVEEATAMTMAGADILVAQVGAGAGQTMEEILAAATSLRADVILLGQRDPRAAARPIQGATPVHPGRCHGTAGLHSFALEPAAPDWTAALGPRKGRP